MMNVEKVIFNTPEHKAATILNILLRSISDMFKSDRKFAEFILYVKCEFFIIHR